MQSLTQDELREMVEARRERLRGHLAGLGSEVTLADVSLGGRPVLDHVRARPLLAAGVAAGLGLLAGLLSGLARRGRGPEPDPHALWMGAYLKDLVEDAAHRVGPDGEGEEALRGALRRRAPVVVIEEKALPAREARSALGGALGVVLNTAVGFGAKLAMDRLAQQLTGEPEVVMAAQKAGEPEPAELPALSPLAL